MTAYSNTHTLLYAKRENDHTLLTPSTDSQHTVSDACFATDDLVYFLTDYNADFTYLASYNLETNEFIKVKDIENEGFTTLKYDQHKQRLYIVSEKGVEDTVYMYDLSSNEWQKIQAPCSTIDKLVVTKSGNLYVLGGTATKPDNIYRLTDNEWIPLTQYAVPGVDHSELVEPEVITYPSFDGLEIESLFFKAKKENDNGKSSSGHMVVHKLQSENSLELRSSSF